MEKIECMLFLILGMWLFLTARRQTLFQDYETNPFVQSRRKRYQHHGPPDSTDYERSAKQLSIALGHLTLVLKDEEDIITDGKSMPSCNQEESGGQGGLLSGSLGVFAHWAFSSPPDETKREVVVLSKCLKNMKEAFDFFKARKQHDYL